MSGRLAWATPVASAVGSLLSAATPALAQQMPNYDDAKNLGAVHVHDRDRTWLDPEGIRYGNYVISPSIGYGFRWNDNIYATLRKDATSDNQHELNTQFKFKSYLPRHMLDFMFTGNFGRLEQNGHYEFKDGGLSGQFRLDIDRAHNVYGNFKYERGHEDHVEPLTLGNATRPTLLDRVTGEVGAQRDAGKIAASAGVRFDTWNYHDVDALGGGIIEQDHRDLRTLSPFVKLNYRPSPGYKILGEVYSHFQSSPSDILPKHDGRGIEAKAGVEFEMSPLVRIALKGGWHALDLEDPRFASVGTAVWDARATWLISPVLTLTAATDRALRSTAFGDASARLQTRYILGAEYEMWRNLVFLAEAELRKDEYIGSDRVDTGKIFRLGANYWHTKNWLFTANYEYRLRNSTTSNVDVTNNKVLLGVKYRY
jgi:hypothetical protein